MTNINELRKRKQEKEEQERQDSINVSTHLFQKQKSSIMDICDTKGFKTIKEFWELQAEQATNALKNVKMSDLQEFGRIQSKANIADKFVDFLSNLEK